jgi:hypothetical protein
MLPRIATGVCAGLLLLAACGGPQEIQTEMPELNSAGSLRTEIDRALREVQEARAGLDPKSVKAQQPLDAAAASLQRLADYYVPVLVARDDAYNAYRLFRMNDKNGAVREIDVAVNILEKTAEAGDESLSKTIQQPLEALGEAKLAVNGDRPDAGPTLQRVVYLLNAMIVKGGLVVREE